MNEIRKKIRTDWSEESLKKYINDCDLLYGQFMPPGVKDDWHKEMKNDILHLIGEVYKNKKQSALVEKRAQM